MSSYIETAKAVAEPFLSRGPLTERWSYDYGVMWRGMQMLYEVTGDERYFDYIAKGLDSFISEDGSIRDYDYNSFNIDFVCNGRMLLYLYQKTGIKKYALACDLLRRQLTEHPRTSEGGFFHKKCYPCQMWLDGLHMGEPFYLEYALAHGEPESTLDDIVNQFTTVYRHTYDEKTGLCRHAWDEARVQPWAEKDTGRSAHAWGRALGWYMIALIDVIDRLPGDYAKRGEMISIFTSLSDALMNARKNGVWYQVPDMNDAPGNYPESSASCMIIYALAKGARTGVLDKRYEALAKESFEAAKREFLLHLTTGETLIGKCCRVAGLGGNPLRDGSYDYYMSEAVISRDLRASGAYIQACCELDRF